MPLFRYLGNAVSYIGGDIVLQRFGQPIELDEQLAFDAMAGGCALIPDEQFQEIGFSNQELELYAEPGSDWAAPESFKQKRKEAVIAYQTRPNRPEDSQ